MFGKLSFKGGVHPPHSKKQTEKLEIKELPAPQKVIIPIAMHIGAPAKPIVKKGDKVKIGDLIAEAGGFVSSPAHASISGEITRIDSFPHPMGKKVTAIEITNDNENSFATLNPLEGNWREAAQGEIVKKIADCGLVGMGGASFPTHVKLSPPSDKPIDSLIINGAECEPFLTADHRMLLEKTEEVLTGISILKKTTGADKAYIGIEVNKPDAIKAVNDALINGKFEGIKLCELATKYPQGGEKQLINAITKREVPSGGLPMDIGCVVQNVGTAYAVWDAVVNGTPLYQRVVTVTGPLTKKPANLLVRIGTPMIELLEYCEADLQNAKKVVSGGPMMGIAQGDLSAPVIKATSGLLVLDNLEEGVRAHECISCGNCVKACPVNLMPSVLAKYVNKEKFEEADDWNILDCMECGSCSFVCPSKINLVHFFKLGKFHVMAARKAKAAK